VVAVLLVLPGETERVEEHCPARLGARAERAPGVLGGLGDKSGAAHVFGSGRRDRAHCAPLGPPTAFGERTIPLFSEPVPRAGRRPRTSSRGADRRQTDPAPWVGARG